MSIAVFNKDPKSGTVYYAMGQSAETEAQGYEQLKANTVDAAVEKHVPIASLKGGKLVIKVGSEPHPMTPEHYIEWIFVKTTYGGIFCDLAPGEEPQTDFPCYAPEEVESVYAYCNLHGLWKAKEPVLPASFDQNPIICSAEFSAGCIDTMKE